MGLFYAPKPIVQGGRARKTFFRVHSDSPQELINFARKDRTPVRSLNTEEAEALRQGRSDVPFYQMELQLPEPIPGKFATRTQCRILIPHETFVYHVRDRWEIALVNENYLPVLNMLCRRNLWEYYQEKRANFKVSPEAEKFFRTELRGKLIQLLRSGQWMDSPESFSVVKLNEQLKKIDLGRRSDLNFSSDQSEETADVTEKFVPEVIKGWHRDSTTEEEKGIESEEKLREEILTKPWLRR